MQLVALVVLAGCGLRSSEPPTALEFRGQRFEGAAPAQAVAVSPNEALVFHVVDLEPSAPTQTFTISAPGWSVTRDVTTNATALFHAIAVRDEDVAFTVTSTAPTAELGVEIAAFATNESDHAPAVTEATAAACACGGGCNTVLASLQDAVWASVGPATIAEPGPSFEQVGLRSEYRLPDAAGTTPIAMTTTPASGSICWLTALSLAPY